ncbi:MAG: bifunctional [glutamate--ammonia ligase]-adenylyl-L-tyrosine phosphorylase/[glutamate--ammonia-ligase] adenylyltransferase [Desulfobacterales bacterium]|jgi:glutamate-ammonia-ligase adenylyltransferase|nr:bifunctional [glutamate--ammonia ligase]-adenylyl-L-tyrosine phosphorylase/[glutamate--ammonia-ligase] adenylyltransferase [Desulfobacterales bacterium]
MTQDSLIPAKQSLESEDYWRAFCDAAKTRGLTPPEDPDFIRIAKPIFYFSEFIRRSCLLDPALPAELVQSGDLRKSGRSADYLPYLQARIASVADEALLGQILCNLRRREMVRIAWRDLAGWADLDETMGDLSAFADACLETTLAYLYRAQCGLYGLPLNAAHHPQQLVVIGMGKLGSRELNFSSDIDLIFAYPESGQTDGGTRAISNEEFFVRLCRKYVKILSTVTSDGPLFRVDIRLRPFGDNGPLVMSFDNMEDYYQQQGRDWERYAWIKARAAAGDLDAGKRLIERLRPFIYRRYFDYSAFESIRDMKLKIAREVAQKKMQNNIKLGPGGIREIEFFGQTFQLLRGGVTPALQCGPIQETLNQLVRENHITPEVCGALTEAYRFLRHTEHRLQEYADQQTHQLPEKQDERQRLAASMGFPEPEAFFQALQRHRQLVHQHFNQLLELEPSENMEESTASFAENLNTRIAALWLAPLSEFGETLLLDAGYNSPKEIATLLDTLHHDPSTRALSPAGKKRLDKVIPELLLRAAQAREPQVVLARLLDLIKTIQRRTTYLALLQENPTALTRLVEFADASPWMISYLMRHPVLLDELLDPRTLYAPPNRPELAEEIDRRYELIDPDDLEYQMEVLRIFKQTNTLRVAAADIGGVLPLMKVSDHLSDIAEISVAKTVDLTWRHLVEKHGTPNCMLDNTPLDRGFAVIAYGKLGGLELGYDSDLDLVFLHACTGAQTRGGSRPLDIPQFFSRLGQRVIHFLSAHTPAGVLYETDMRLRPSGTSGLLVCHIDAWEEYQMKDAWTWEHQALVRARGICGDSALIARFETVRLRALSRPRRKAILKKEVSDMRERMRREHGGHPSTDFNLKHDPGGMVDIEFLVQYIVLLMAHRYPQLLKWTDNVRQIQALAEEKIIGDDMAHQLRTAYLTYRSMAHRLSLQEAPPVVPADQFKAYRQTIMRFWHHVLGQPDQPPKGLS